MRCANSSRVSRLSDSMVFLFRSSGVPCLPLLISAGILAGLPASSIAQEQADDSAKAWSATLRMIRARFPEVAHISTDTLQSWLERAPKRQDLILLDVREPEEFAVSHLRGARPTPSKDEALRTLQGSPANRRIVLYCSVGYRSSELAGFLMRKGYTEVYNLEGSIFRWVNEGRPVFRGTERVQVVHPYDTYWGRLLRKPLHRAGPDASGAPRATPQ